MINNINYETIFASYIREHASSYYPDFINGQIFVELLDKEERPSAILYRYKVSNKTQNRSVFIKVPLRNSTRNQTGGNDIEKPLLFPKTEPNDMHWLHYTALKTIYEYFTGLDKKQLGAIRVLDHLPQYHAIFTEESSDPNLRQLFSRESRFRPPFRHNNLIAPFHNAGNWLREYHLMPKEEDVKVRHPYRDDYIEMITSLTNFLGKTLGNRSFFYNVASIVITKGQEVLPESLPLGLGHGDYAMRNILVGQNARITVLDTFAKWRTPIYEDIGYFLNGLRMSYPQVISQGLAYGSDKLASYEQAFLKGYFGNDPIAYPEIKLFEALALLDKWSSTVSQIHRQTSITKSIAGLKVKLVSQYFKRRTKKLLIEFTNH